METKIDPVEIGDEDISEEDFSPDELADDTTDWKAKAQELKGLNKRRATKLRKAKESLGKVSELEAELATLRKPPEKKENKSDNTELLEKLDRVTLRAAGYAAEEEVELAKAIKLKTGMDMEKVIEDDYFKSKVESLRTAKANQIATSNVRGEGGKPAEKNTPEYYLAKGELPEKTPENRHLRAEIMRKLSAQATAGKKFYNE